MDIQIPKETLHWILRNGGIAVVSEEELRARHLVRIYDPERESHRLLTSKEYGELVAASIRVMRTYRGYIFAHDWNRMQGLIERRQVIAREDFVEIVGRAKAHVNAGVPPIFVPEMYTKALFVYHVKSKDRTVGEVRYESLFPGVDLIIQYGSGSYERKCAQAGAVITSRGEKRTKLSIQPADPKDVFRFRSRVFTQAGEIDPFFRLEILDYISRHFDFRTEERKGEILAEDEIVLTFLEEQLRDCPHDEHAYERWNRDASVVRERCWYLRYDPTERVRIACAYLLSLKEPPKNGESETFLRLCALFPDLCAERAAELKIRVRTLERERVQHALDIALREKDLRNLPPAVFTQEPWKTEALPEIRRVFSEICREYPLTHLFRNSDALHQSLPIPLRLALLPSFKALLDQIRLERLQTVSDEEFLNLFRTRQSTNYGHTKNDEWGNPEGRHLLDYIVRRRRSLCAS
jgi:hypothetical protein